MKRKLTGQVAAVMLGLDPQSIFSTRCPSVHVTYDGFEGDRHAGPTRITSSGSTYPRGTEIRNNRQVSIVSADELAEVAVVLGIPAIEAEWIGANLLLRDVPALTLLPPGTRLFFPQDAVLVVDGENLPCTTSGQVIQDQYPDVPNLTSGFPKAGLHKRGLVAWVERPGLIHDGDQVRVEVPEQVIYSF